MKVTDSERETIFAHRKDAASITSIQTLRQYRNATPKAAERELYVLRQRYDAAQVELKALRTEVARLRAALGQ